MIFREPQPRNYVVYPRPSSFRNRISLAFQVATARSYVTIITFSFTR